MTPDDYSDDVKLEAFRTIREIEVELGLTHREEVIARTTKGAMRALGKNRLKMVTYLSTLAVFGHRGFALLEEGLGFHPNVVYAKAMKADRRGWIEWGTSPRGAWLTDAGWDRVIEIRPDNPEFAVLRGNR